MEEEYDKIKEKFELPEFKEIDDEFQIATIETENQHLPREIAKKMNEKIEFITTILEEILNPERLSSLQESSMFNEENKKDILEIYRKLNFYHRQNTLLEVSYVEEDNISFIKDFFNTWKEISPKIKKTIKKMRDSWKNNNDKKLELNYYG
jgi:hypothetical protein